MTREQIMELGFEEIEKRAAEIATETAEADAEKIEALDDELKAIEERKAILVKEVEERKAAVKDVVEGKGEEIKIEVEERKIMDVKEIRNSNAYIEAFANYVKTGDDKECRALLTDNTNGGVIPAPVFVGDIVAEGVRESEILRRVRTMNAAGNVKMSFEITAPAAGVHTEGGEAMTEEALVLGIVTLVPSTYKKWVGISDEALDTMSGESFLRYIYAEVTRGIIKAQEDAVVAAIEAAPQTATSARPAVAAYSNGGTATIADFVQARALLSSAARDLVLIMTPAQYAEYRALQMGANYGVDPFDGLEVLFNDTVTAPIIGDLGGILRNLPKGDAIEFKYDDRTRMKEDLVDILGRQPAAIGLVANKYFAKVTEE